ncbi:hypothetical protein Hanom_Chr15g01410521 [Helianthus anomalus]
MASTTSAVATMLLSGSMSSAEHGFMNPNLLAQAIRPSSSSIATISASAPFPTTHPPNNFQKVNSTAFEGHPSSQYIPSAAAMLLQVFHPGMYNQSRFTGFQLSHDKVSNQLIPHQIAPNSICEFLVKKSKLKYIWVPKFVKNRSSALIFVKLSLVTQKFVNI